MHKKSHMGKIFLQTAVLFMSVRTRRNICLRDESSDYLRRRRLSFASFLASSPRFLASSPSSLSPFSLESEGTQVKSNEESARRPLLRSRQKPFPGERTWREEGGLTLFCRWSSSFACTLAVDAFMKFLLQHEFLLTIHYLFLKEEGEEGED